MTLPQISAPARKSRSTARDRQERLVRIFARMEEGWSYDAIARDEGLTRERIRQIVSQTLDNREFDDGRRHKLLQLGRLAPALRLAGTAIAEGDLKAIDRLVRVLDRIDKYQDVIGGGKETSEEARRTIIEKLNRMAAKREAAEAEARQAELAAWDRERAEMQARLDAALAATPAPVAAPETPPSADPPASGDSVAAAKICENGDSVFIDPQAVDIP